MYDDDYVESNVAQNRPEDLINNARMGGKYSNPVLFPADNLIRKMGNNLATSEALTDEQPLRTENSYDSDKEDND